MKPNFPTRRSHSFRNAARAVIETLEQRIQFTALPLGFTESVVAADLGKPTAIDVLPDGRVLVTTQDGDLRVLKNNALVASPALHLDVDSAGERGLLGVAHDPNFASNGFIYLYHTVKPTDTVSTHNEVTRYTLNGDAVEEGSALDLLQLNDLTGATNHNGGALHFGTDNLLYIATGDNARPDNSQTVGNLLGKILRIDVSNSTFGDPVNDTDKLLSPDNPFFNKGATGIYQAIYALGLRNPFTFAVQADTGQIFVNDVGQDTWEEIDPLIVGRNYGWGKVEGFAGPLPPVVGPGPYQDPIMAYNHGNATPVTAATGAAIIGGAFYNPDFNASNPFPTSYVGKYFFADLGSNFIRTFDPANPGNASDPDTSSSFATGTTSNPTSLALAPDGGLYYAAIGSGGQLMKISYSSTFAINAGGGAAGTFGADSHFTGGGSAIRRHVIDTSHVTNPAPQWVYETYRYGNFSYNLDGLEAGKMYDVVLDFSENRATQTGERVFDVAMNGNVVLNDYDIFAAAGGAFIATQQTFRVAASDAGTIDITFTTVIGNARVNAISVFPVVSVPITGQVGHPVVGVTGSVH